MLANRFDTVDWSETRSDFRRRASGATCMDWPQAMWRQIVAPQTSRIECLRPGVRPDYMVAAGTFVRFVGRAHSGKYTVERSHRPTVATPRKLLCSGEARE